MSAPNIVNVTTITGSTTPYSVTTSSASLVTNSLGNSVYKIDTVIVTNTTATSIKCYLSLYRSSTDYPIAYGISVPASSAVTLLAKDTSLYLQENDQLRIYADSSGLYAISSYEVIS